MHTSCVKNKPLFAAGSGVRLPGQDPRTHTGFVPFHRTPGSSRSIVRRGNVAPKKDVSSSRTGTAGLSPCSSDAYVALSAPVPVPALVATFMSLSVSMSPNARGHPLDYVRFFRWRFFGSLSAARLCNLEAALLTDTAVCSGYACPRLIPRAG